MMPRPEFMSFMKTRNIVIGVIGAILSWGCESDYTRLVKTELRSETYYDSLVFDLKLGDTKKTFYEKCWSLNKQGLIMQGPENNYVQYFLGPDSLATSIRMLFYGDFNEEHIMHAMDMKFAFVGWAPWNEDLQSDRLLIQLKDSLERWYPGNEFIEVDFDTEPTSMWVKVDGNRQVAMYVSGFQDVVVRISDLKEKYKDGF